MKAKKTMEEKKMEQMPEFIFKSKGTITIVEIKVPKSIEEKIRKEVITTSGTLVSI